MSSASLDCCDQALHTGLLWNADPVPVALSSIHGTMVHRIGRANQLLRRCDTQGMRLSRLDLLISKDTGCCLHSWWRLGIQQSATLIAVVIAVRCSKNQTSVCCAPSSTRSAGSEPSNSFVLSCCVRTLMMQVMHMVLQCSV